MLTGQERVGTEHGRIAAQHGPKTQSLFGVNELRGTSQTQLNKSMRDWFTVDKDGLAKVLGRRGKAFAMLELIQNAWDAPGATQVEVTLKPAARGRALLIVEDNSPNGFSDLAHAYTLFKESAKKADPTKRGRFDVGEKLVLAICDCARICTTRGTLMFD